MKTATRGRHLCNLSLAFVILTFLNPFFEVHDARHVESGLIHHARTQGFVLGVLGVISGIPAVIVCASGRDRVDLGQAWFTLAFSLVASFAWFFSLVLAR